MSGTGLHTLREKGLMQEGKQKTGMNAQNSAGTSNQDSQQVYLGGDANKAQLERPLVGGSFQGSPRYPPPNPSLHPAPLSVLLLLPADQNAISRQRTTVKKSTYAPDWDEPALLYLSDVRFPYYSTQKSATMHVTSASPYKSTQRLARVCAGTGAVPSIKPGFVRCYRARGTEGGSVRTRWGRM
eukprot:86492-Rhodomonas_salina.1